MYMYAMHIEVWGCWELSLFALPPYLLREGLSFKCWYGYSQLTFGSAPPPVSVFQDWMADKPPYLPGIQVGSGDLKSGPLFYMASAVATDWGVFLTWCGRLNENNLSKIWANLHVYFLVYLCFTSPLFYVAVLSWERSCQPWSKWSHDWGLMDWRENSWAGEKGWTWNCKGNISLQLGEQV